MSAPLHTRERVRSYLRDQMMAGLLEPGAKVNLPTIARALELSVTPVREALTQLAYSGALQVEPLRGFFVPQLSVPEARLCYHAVVALETEALRMAAPASKADLDLLDRYAGAFAAAKHAEDRLRADAAFHELLCQSLASTPLAEVLADWKVRIFYYERAFLDSHELFDESVKLHASIVSALRLGEIDQACEALRQNWLNVAAVLYPRVSQPSES